MPFNLVDEPPSPVPPGRRSFYAPLASIPPGRAAVRAIDRNLFTISESYAPMPVDPSKTADVSLNVQITPPAGGFVDEDSLPDPLVRLHATDKALVSFQPATATMRDSLVIKMLTLAFAAPGLSAVSVMPKWWTRWVEAACVPLTIIYENVDRVHLEALLNDVVAPLGIADSVPATNGLRFPLSVTQARKANYIAQFLSGAAGNLEAVAGAVIGIAGSDPADAARRLLRLHVRYHDHTDASPHPMNPRELFHLLFGNDSYEAQNHPLLLRIHEIGQGQAVQPMSKRMLLRPPLRTHGRLVWEAELEINHFAPEWRPAGSLGPDRFFNDHDDGIRRFNDGPYGGSHKCNLFTSDIAVRAGFRAGVHPADTKWHYMDANSHANHVQQAGVMTDRVAIQGRDADADLTWAWKIESWIRAQPAADRQRLLNELMTGEGRVLVVAGARARKFLPHEIIPGVDGFANCGASLRRRTGIGHIVLVREVLAQPQLAGIAGDGLQQIEIRTLEASGAGAQSRVWKAQVGGAAGTAAAGVGFIRLHLFELHPGGDPDTAQGLRNLNVRSSNPNLLDTANERALNRRLSHNPDGTIRGDNVCCHDNHPPRNAPPTQVPC